MSEGNIILYDEMKFLDKSSESITNSFYNKINFEEMKTGLVKGFSQNPIIIDAKKGKSVYDSLRELEDVNKGFKSFFPRRKNNSHDDRVEALERVIGNYSNLQTGGFPFDNFVVGGSLGAFGAGFLVYEYREYLEAMSEAQTEFVNICGTNYNLTDVLAVGATICGGLVFAKLANSSRKIDPNMAERAKYIDAELEKLL